MNPNETQGSELDEPGMDAESCPTCGMDRKDWAKAQGYQLGGESYCCQGCAEGTGCTCAEDAAQARSTASKQKRGATLTPRSRRRS